MSWPQSQGTRLESGCHIEDVTGAQQSPFRTVRCKRPASRLINLDAADRPEPGSLEAEVQTTGAGEGGEDGGATHRKARPTNIGNHHNGPNNPRPILQALD